MATGTITVRNPNGKSGTFHVITVGPEDECDTDIACLNKDITYVDPHGTMTQGQNAIGRIINAGNSGVMVVIELQPN